MDAWLATLEGQLSASMPTTPKIDVPDINLSWEWVGNLCDSVLEDIETELDTDGQICHRTAMRVQEALLAAFIIGAYAPPPR
jgi:hypothetical protein